MKIDKKYFKWVPTINGLLTFFSLICLYFAFGFFDALHGEVSVKIQCGAGCLGMISCFVPILIWALRWPKLDKNYRQIAAFFFIVFITLLFLHIRNLLKISG